MVARDRWQTHCASFSNKTGLHTLWNTFKALQGKTKTPNLVRTIALKQNKSIMEITHEAAQAFFPQPASSPPDSVYALDLDVDETNPLKVRS
ncbi:hypothetical protein HPB48_016917 [Haemaphysalis longicornis]|uniref:Uncharacterized protein n=1 Tax=Haemaphysalis longicornis TaxID=44386 RepID=A0A9J6G189_HAELO|nr:hypothetical protein HPB48_016917 [Haemaphysalis longicornis]